MSTQQTDANALQELKKNLRAQAHERRNAQENKDGLSEIICDQLMYFSKDVIRMAKVEVAYFY